MTSQISPLNSLWQAPVIVWTLLAGEGVAAVLALAPGIGSDRWVYFGLASLVIQWVLLMTLGALYLLRNKLQSARAPRIAYLSLLLMIAAAWLVYGLGSWLLRD